MFYFQNQFLHFLIGFFTMLVVISFYGFFKKIFRFSLVEGLEDVTSSTDNVSADEKEDEYKDYDTSNPDNVMILAQQNAGNIISLKQQLKDQFGITDRVVKLESDMLQQQEQINGLVEQQAQYAEDISASEPVEITGMDE